MTMLPTAMLHTCRFSHFENGAILRMSSVVSGVTGLIGAGLAIDQLMLGRFVSHCGSVAPGDQRADCPYDRAPVEEAVANVTNIVRSYLT